MVDFPNPRTEYLPMHEPNEDPKPWHTNLIFAVILLVLSVQAVVEWVGYGVRSYRAIGTERWVAIEAEVQRSEAVEHGNFLTGTGWLPRIGYAYEFDGTSHTGDRFSFNNPANGLTESEALRLASSFSKGQKIEIHVDPDDPTQSTMIQEHDEDRPVGFLIDVLSLVIGLIMLYGVIVDLRSRRQAPANDAVPDDAS